MKRPVPSKSSRVRRNTPARFNQLIDQQTRANIRQFAPKNKEDIRARIAALDKEWDIERALEATSSINVLIGLALGLTVNKKWLILSTVSAAFMVQHSIQGWCPPLPLLRKLGIRTREEINVERMALQKRL